MTPHYVCHAEIRLTELAGEGVVLHLGEKRYFTVNETGLAVLNALKSPRTFDELVAAVLAEFEVEADVATETTQAFLDQCLAANVVRVVAA
ncbi:MAG: PqqD family protein [Gemmatimonadales bacterium]